MIIAVKSSVGLSENLSYLQEHFFSIKICNILFIIKKF